MNINGYCPHCNADLDGDLVIHYPLSQGYTIDDALEYAQSYEGWAKHGLLNKWSRYLTIQDIWLPYNQYQCPDCKGTWK
jgi:hypothetical protein